ncbi:MAG: hypothetical protein AB7K04_06415 [Pseudorhodoplanes sp.]
MKIALALRYRVLMAALLPVTLGVGTIALWALSRKWPLVVDAEGITLRHHRKVPWGSISKIGLRRDYLGGQVSRIDIHHDHGTSRIPTCNLHDGERVAADILYLFKQSRGIASSAPARAPQPYWEMQVATPSFATRTARVRLPDIRMNPRQAAAPHRSGPTRH